MPYYRSIYIKENLCDHKYRKENMFKYDLILQHYRNITMDLNTVYKFLKQEPEYKTTNISFKIETSLEEMSDFWRAANY